MARWVALLALLAAPLAGCSRGTPIPAGAQEVHIAITQAEVRLDPAVVQAGDVYLVLDAPLEGSFAFVQSQKGASETPGPLSADDLDRLASGDTEGTSIDGMDVGGCSPAQDAEDRGQMGPCGNVMKFVLTPGRYAIVGGTPEGDPATGRQPPIAVLEVLP